MEDEKSVVKVNTFFPCECGSEGLLCTRFLDEKKIYLAMFRYGQYQKKPNFFKRLKFCFYHIRTGKYYEDQLILNFDESKKLGEWLIENSNKK